MFFYLFIVSLDIKYHLIKGWRRRRKGSESRGTSSFEWLKSVKSCMVHTNKIRFMGSQRKIEKTFGRFSSWGDKSATFIPSITKKNIYKMFSIITSIYCVEIEE